MAEKKSDAVLWQNIANASDAISAMAKIQLALPTGCDLEFIDGDDRVEQAQLLVKMFALTDKISEIVSELEARLNPEESNRTPHEIILRGESSDHD